MHKLLRKLAQVPAKAQAADPTAPVRQALTLAEGGRCAEALPVLKRNTARPGGQTAALPCRLCHRALRHERQRHGRGRDGAGASAARFPRRPGSALHRCPHLLAVRRSRGQGSGRTVPQIVRRWASSTRRRSNRSRCGRRRSRPTATSWHRIPRCRASTSASPAFCSTRRRRAESRRGSEKGTGSGARDQSQERRSRVRAGRDRAAGRRMGRSHPALHARLAIGCRLPGGLLLARHVAQRGGQVRGRHRAAGALCQGCAGRPGGTLSACHCLLPHRQQGGRGSRTAASTGSPGKKEVGIRRPIGARAPW